MTQPTKVAPVHPKVAAAGSTAAVVSLAVAVLAVAGVNLDGDTEQALAVIVAAALPVVAGWVKKA